MLRRFHNAMQALQNYRVVAAHSIPRGDKPLFDAAKLR